jgi:transposase
MTQYKIWVGIDWGHAEHRVCALDSERRVVMDRSVGHDARSVNALLEALEKLAALSEIAVAIETPRASIVETLVDRGIAVFSLNPKQLDRFRDRHSAAGAKDDRRDAFVLADSLRTDQPSFRRVRLAAAHVVQLRELTRMHEELVEEQVMLGNRLRDQIHRFYPQILQLGSLHEERWLWALLERAPTPEAGKRLSLAKIGTILKDHRIRRLEPADVRTVLQLEAIHVAPGVVDAATRHARDLLQRLRLVDQQLRECDRDIESLLDELTREPPEDASPEKKREHRDARVLRSLPGVGIKVCATMLAEAWQPLEDRDYRTLRAQCGVAPVTKQSGKTTLVTMRRACNHRLRNAMHHWAENAVQRDPSDKARYTRLRAEGKSHGHALRAVADRLLDVLLSMLRKGTAYDAVRRQVA